SGLASPIRADQADKLTGSDIKRCALQHAFAAELCMKITDAEQPHIPTLLERWTSHRKKGAPMSAVRTPIFRSRPGAITRTRTSAVRSTAAPPSALTGRSLDGTEPTSGRNICGTTKPIKPMAPLTETAAPTEAAVPTTASVCNLETLTPIVAAASLPSVSVSRERPSDASMTQPASIKGPASHTCVIERSFSEPSIQNRISIAANGFGDRLSTSVAIAPANDVTATPA